MADNIFERAGLTGHCADSAISWHGAASRYFNLTKDICVADIFSDLDASTKVVGRD